MTKARTFANVWDALEDSPEKAATMTMRSNVMIAINDAVRGWHTTQARAARRLGITQPRLNDLLHGKDRGSFAMIGAAASRRRMAGEDARPPTRYDQAENSGPREQKICDFCVDERAKSIVRIACAFYRLFQLPQRRQRQQRRQVMAKSTQSRSAPSRVYQIKVTLTGSEPPIWRRLVVPGSISLAALHRILQISMGWDDDHLHAFQAAKRRARRWPEPGELDLDDEERVHLDQVLAREKSVMVYMYDFGDSWEHDIVVEKILASSDGVGVPSCIGGERACPPEDSGGVWGYDNLLAAIRDSTHPEHKMMLDWVGDEFDPERFDIDAVNARLGATKRTRAA
jgi:predicted XRE-type DNA-binding protein